MRLFITGILLVAVLSVPAFATYDYTITGGYFGTLTLENSETLLMTGGGDSLEGRDHSVLDIRNTAPLVKFSGGIWTFDIMNSSRLNFSGGQVYQFTIGYNSTAVFSGGRIDQIWSYQTVGWLHGQPVGQHIEMICKAGYNYNATTKILTGVWGNDTAFNIQLVNVSGYDAAIDNINFTIIPEPASLLLLAFGGLLLKRR